jgi:acylphosphatase
MKRCLSILVTGKVQGVFYRASARDKANELGLTGFAQNKEDGGVYIEAEGSEEGLQKFEKWCWQGPPKAKVVRVLTESREIMNFAAFEIKR